MTVRIKCWQLLLVVSLFISSFVIALPSSAQVGVTTPSDPVFGVEYMFWPSVIPASYGVDPSTGKAVLTQWSYTVYSETAFVSIASQPFVPYKDTDGNSIELYYNIRWKDPSNNSWMYLPPSCRLRQQDNFHNVGATFSFKDSYVYSGSSGATLNIPMGTQTDFQVEALIGYYTANNTFVGKTSGWTEKQWTQLQEIPSDLYDHTPNPTPNPTPYGTSPPPTPTPSIPEFSGIVLMVLALIPFSLLAVKRKRK